MLGHWGLSRGVGEGGGGVREFDQCHLRVFPGGCGERDLLKLRNSHIALKREHWKGICTYLLTYLVPY